MKYVVIAVVWALSLYWAMGEAFTAGYEQGYVNGKQRAEITEEQVLQVCTAWWFGEGNPRAMQAINQYCDRR